jgi:hypothetical protein
MISPTKLVILALEKMLNFHDIMKECTNWASRCETGQEWPKTCQTPIN